MDLQRALASEGVLALSWLVFVAVYGLLVFQFLAPTPWADHQYVLWQLTSYLAEILALGILGIGFGHLWVGDPSILGSLLAGLSIIYVPLHFVMSRGLFLGTDLGARLAHYRQPFYVVLTILAVVLLIRSIVYRPAQKRTSNN